MDRPVLPEFFLRSEAGQAAAARKMSDMQYRLFVHFEKELQFLNECVVIDSLQQRRIYRYRPAVLMRFPAVVWTSLTATQKTDLRNRYVLMEEESPGVWVSFIEGLIDVRSFESTLTGKGFRLGKDHDFEVSPGKITYVSDPETENWDSTGFMVSIKGRPTPVSVSVMTGVLQDAVFSQDWYYKRMGILLGLPEDTSPYKVMALYRITCEGVSDSSLNAFVEAFSDYGISLRTDRIKAVRTGTVESENESYTVPSAGAVTVRPGNTVVPGQPLFRCLFTVSDSMHPGWASDAGIINLFQGTDPEFTTDVLKILSGAVSPNERLLWGQPLPVRMSDTDEQSIGLWSGAPVISLPVLKFVAGSDPDYAAASSANIVLYSTLDIPDNIPAVNISYNNAGGDITIDNPIAETVQVETSGMFMFSSGISGRVMDRALPGSWNGSVTQARSVVDVTADSDGTTTVFDLSSTVFNQGIEPEAGDWVWVDFGGSWYKLRLTSVSYDDDLVPVSAEAPNYGIGPVPGSYSAVIFRSYDGNPYRGVDDAVIDSFQRLLDIVSRHIEVVVIDGSVVNKTTVQNLLREYTDRLSIWKAFVVVAAADTKQFMDIRGVING